MGDPGPFLIPCKVNGSEPFMSLSELGASINFMPLSIYIKLVLGDLSPTKMGVKLIDQTINPSVGIAEDLVVKVGDMEFPTNFVIFDIKEDPVVPLVLGRPFLATAGSFFDFRTGKLTLKDKGKCASIKRKMVNLPPKPSITQQVVASVQCTTSLKRVGSPTRCGGGLTRKVPSKLNHKNDILDKSMRKLYG
ncbi:uncharacterized protein [Rutidosis leptorrhynchoides]|uniref:uncharacterized protein n=1 Tax=Rutidosis leptorrhynchoides TaxID=125765 RepID=UPI003A996B70